MDNIVTYFVNLCVKDIWKVNIKKKSCAFYPAIFPGTLFQRKKDCEVRTKLSIAQDKEQ